MLTIDADVMATLLNDHDIVNALCDAFRAGCEMPVRHHHRVAVPGGPDGTLLLMPAWRPGVHLGLKIATVFPANAARGEPSVHAVYMLLNATTGRALARFDGGELTARRTAGTSVLAAEYLARPDSTHLLVVGTGRIARHIVRAYVSVRPGLQHVTIWGRDFEKSRAFVQSLAIESAIKVTAVHNLEAAVRGADIVSCATLSTAPLICGAWLKPGTHLDLIGAFTPTTREADDTTIERSRVFCDSPANAVTECGEFLAPIASGILRPQDVLSLASLCRGEIPGRGSADDITLFKSVGAAIEDLALAELVYEKLRG